MKPDFMYEKEREIMLHNLKYIRGYLSLTEEQLGKLLGVTRQTINNIEKRKQPLTVTYYLAIRELITSKEYMENLTDEQIKFNRKLLSKKVISFDYSKGLKFEKKES